jgi:unsaturated rhamnogalacturonyl hydrolase
MASTRLPATEVHKSVNLLIDNLVNIKDETGRFLMPLADGRIIDTKSWHGWEWTVC